MSARQSEPGRPDAEPKVASPYDLGVERENNREYVVAEPFRQRSECTGCSRGFNRALGFGIEAVTAGRLHDRNCHDAAVPLDHELNVGGEHLLLAWLEPQRDQGDDVVQIRWIREILPGGGHVRDVRSLAARFSTAGLRRWRIEARTLRVRHLRGARRSASRLARRTPHWHRLPRLHLGTLRKRGIRLGLRWRLGRYSDLSWPGRRRDQVDRVDLTLRLRSSRRHQDQRDDRHVDAGRHGYGKPQARSA